MDTTLIGIMRALPIIKSAVCLLMGVIATILIMRLFNVRSILTGKGITDSLKDINKSRSRDYFILNSNKFLISISKIVQNGPFKISRTTEDYINYNLNRANLRVPGGMRVMSAKEFNALKIVCTGLFLIIDIIILVAINYLLGLVLIVITLIVGSMVPTQILRMVVKQKDDEITEQFTDLYLMLHYVLITGAKTPIHKVMRTYAKTTDSEELKRFIEIAYEYMDSHGEQEATKYIMADYREVEPVCALMKLIKQLYDGGDTDIKNDLLAFRTKVVDKKEYILTKRMDVLIAKARRSFIILMIILFQAIISAMAIYLPDMNGIQSLF